MGFSGAVRYARILASALAATAATAAALGTASADAKAQGHGHPMVPKGFAYAAEARLIVVGEATATLSTAQTTYNVCDADPQSYSETDTAAIKYEKVVYPHITVPIATEADLGRAYAKLHVRPTPTAAATERVTDGTYRIDGNGASESDLCDSVAYNAAGALNDSGNQATFHQTLDAAGNLDAFALDLLGASQDASDQLTADPATYTDSLGNDDDVVGQLVPNVFGADPIANDDSDVSWDSVAVLDDPDKFRPLGHMERVVTSPSSDHYRTDADCGSTTDPGVSQTSCKVHWDFFYSLTFIPLHVYRTKRAYRK